MISLFTFGHLLFSFLLFFCFHLLKTSKSFFSPLGDILWYNDYGSPIVGLYLLERDGLRSLPFQSMGVETLQHLSEQTSSSWESVFTQYVTGSLM